MDSKVSGNPIKAAYNFFDQKDVDGIYIVSAVRSILGVYATVAASAPQRSALLIFADIINKGILAGTVAIVAAAVGALVVYHYANDSGRMSMKSGVRDFLESLGAGLAIVAFGVFVIIGGLDNVFVGAGVLLGAVLVIPVLWLSVFGFVGIILGARTVFRLADMHPLLAPAVAGTVATSLIVLELINLDPKGVPINTWLTIALGGYVTSLALTIYEYLTARRDGFTWLAGWCRPH